MKKNILIVAYTTFIYAIVLITILSSCTSSSREAYENRKLATEVTIHSDKPIVIETLHSSTLKGGIYKIKVDSSEYIYISSATGVSIVKHK